MTMLQTKAAEPDLPSSRILPALGFGEWLFLLICDLDIPCALTASVGIGVSVAGSSRAAATLPGEQEEKAMVQFTVNPNRHDPYKQFKFRVRMEGRIVAGVTKVGALRRSTEVIEHREGGDPSTSRKSPGRTQFQPIVLERGLTHDTEFEDWANKVWRLGQETSLADFRRDIVIELINEAGQIVIAYNVHRCWPSEYVALPDLDANATEVAFEQLILQNEGWERDLSVAEPKEPSF
jgi:phage tail-like protein